MRQFTNALILGAAAAGIAWAAGFSPWETAVLGVGFGALCWLTQYTNRR